MPLGPHQSRSRRCGAVQDERGKALVALGVLDGRRGAGGGPAAGVQSAGDVGEVGARLAAAQDGLGTDARAAGQSGRVAERGGGLRGRNAALLHHVGHPLRAQGRQCGLRGVAVHAELLGDPGRGEGGIVVQELRDAHREQVARDLVTGARRAASASAGTGAGAGV